MTSPENEICLVCNEELEPGGPDVVIVETKRGGPELNWHKECLGFIPSREKWDRIDQDTGHAIWKRYGVDIDMSVLLGGKGFYDARGGEDGEPA